MSTPITYSPQQQEEQPESPKEEDIEERMQRMIELQYEQQQHEEQRQHHEALNNNPYEQWTTIKDAKKQQPKPLTSTQTQEQLQEDSNEEGVGFGTLFFGPESQQILTANYTAASSTNSTPRIVPKTFSYEDAALVSSSVTTTRVRHYEATSTTASRRVHPYLPPLTTNKDIINMLQTPVPKPTITITKPTTPPQQYHHQQQQEEVTKKQSPLHLQQQERQQLLQQQHAPTSPTQLPISPHMQHDFMYRNPDNYNRVENDNAKSAYYDEFYDKRSYRNYMQKSERDDKERTKSILLLPPSTTSTNLNIAAALRRSRSSTNRNSNFCWTLFKKCCCIFFKAIIQKCIYMFYFCISCVCCCCFMIRKEQKVYYKSFCYGAIDGLLTGSSIVATFLGMDLFPLNNTMFVLFQQQEHPSSSLLLAAATTSSTTTTTSLFSMIQILQFFILLFTITTCFADSICMGLGHIWTTYIMINHMTHQRKKQLTHVQTNKAQVKSKVIHQFVEQYGMLKIDAMSLADTFEGYPDLLVNVLIGEPIIGSTVSGSNNSTSSTSHPLASHANAWKDNNNYNNNDPTKKPLQGTSLSLLPPTKAFPSYGGSGTRSKPTDDDHDIDYYDNSHTHDSMLMDDDDEVDDEEEEILHQTLKESQKEGLCMMLGFSLFAMIPSFLQYALPRLVYHFFVVVPAANTTTTYNYGSTTKETSMDDHDVVPSSTTTTDDAAAAAMGPGGISDFTVIVFVTCIIMWCLGIWKSRFFVSEEHSKTKDSTTTTTTTKYYWMFFGVETVMVLLICMISAYSVGAFLCYLFPQIHMVSQNLIQALQIIEQQQQQQQQQHLRLLLQQQE